MSLVSASFGTFNTIDAKAAFGGAITDTLSARLSLLYQSQSDWIDNGFTGENNALGGNRTGAFRLQLLWTPSERFNALLNVHAWDLDGTARVFRANILEHGSDNVVDGFDQDRVYQDGLNDQPISARLASSFSRNGMSAAATDTTCLGETSM